MTNAAIHSAIRARFAAEIAVKQSLTTIYDNDPTKPPTDGSNWCRLTIKRADNQQVEAGPASFRKHGRIYAQLFGPVDRGAGALIELADIIVTAFEGVTAGGVRYQEATVRPIGNDRQGAYQVNVEIRFMAD